MTFRHDRFDFLFNLIPPIIAIIFGIVFLGAIWNVTNSDRLTKECLDKGGTVSLGVAGVYEGCLIGPNATGVIIRQR